MSGAVLALDAVTKRFGGSAWGLREPHTAVDAVSLHIEPGERVGLIGESGSGKTTMARMAVGLIRPDAGRVLVNGRDTAGWWWWNWLAARRELQLLFQNPRAMLNPAMTIGSLLTESAALHRGVSGARRAAHEVLDEVGLGGRHDAYPHQLSGGELRRAGIARTLLARPRVVIADEPTAGLDAALKASLIELLVEKIGPECAFVLISHDLPMVAWACRRLCVMKQGRIVDRFATEDLHDPARHQHTRTLVAAAGLTGGRGWPALPAPDGADARAKA